MRSRSQCRNTRVYLSSVEIQLAFSTLQQKVHQSRDEGHLSHHRLNLTATKFYALGFRVRHQDVFQCLKVLGFREQLQRSSSGSPDHSTHHTANCLH